MSKNKLFTKLLLFAYLLIVVSCSGNGKKNEKTESVMEASLIEVSIGGMTCTGCEQTIQTVVGKLEGIKSVKASFTSGNALVEYYPEIVDSVKIRETITGTGYTVKKIVPMQTEEVAK